MNVCALFALLWLHTNTCRVNWVHMVAMVTLKEGWTHWLWLWMSISPRKNHFLRLVLVCCSSFCIVGESFTTRCWPELMVGTAHTFIYVTPNVKPLRSDVRSLWNEGESVHGAVMMRVSVPSLFIGAAWTVMCCRAQAPSDGAPGAFMGGGDKEAERSQLRVHRLPNVCLRLHNNCRFCQLWN